MADLDSKQLLIAHSYWLRNYPYRKADKELQPYLESNLKAVEAFNPGWLKQARQALFLSQEAVAQKMGVSKAAYSVLEENEAKGVITLQSLKRAAEAMDCELVYAIRPKQKKLYSQLIWEKLFKETKDHPFVKNSSPINRGRALAGMATMKMNEPKVRRKFGWARRILKIVGE